MRDWVSSPLSALTLFQKGRKVEVSEYARAGYVPYLGASVLDGGPITEFACTSRAVIASECDVLMLWDGERSGLVGRRKSGVVSSTVSKLSPKPGIDSGLLYYLLDLHFEWIQGRRTGTGVPHVPKDLSRILVLRHPTELGEQQRIGEILSVLDETIEQTQELIAKMQQIKTGLMHDLFARGVTPDGQLRPPREHAPKLYKQSPLGWIPEAWTCRLLGQCIGRIESGWSPNCESEPADLDDWGVLKTTAVVWDGYSSAENKKLMRGSFPISSIEVRKDDLLITRKGPVDRVGVAVHVAETRSNLMFPDTVFRTRIAVPDELSPAFTALAMGSPAVQKHWWQRKVGLAEAQVNLNHGILKATPFPIPDPIEQAAICERANGIGNELSGLKSELLKLTNLKQGLMYDLLTGHTCVESETGAESQMVVVNV